MLDFHEVANLFPLMSDIEFGNLVEDIKANGLLEPIWLHFGKIIDGRNRYKACLQAGVEPKFRTYNGAGEEDLVQFVVSLNLKRRHLEKGQLAVIALDIEAQLAEIGKRRMAEAGTKHNGNQHSNKVENLEGFPNLGNLPNQDLLVTPKPLPDKPKDTPAPIKASKQAASMIGVSHGYVDMAKRIAAASPELAAKVKAGEVSISDASKQLKQQERANDLAELKKQGELSTTPNDIILLEGDLFDVANDIPDGSVDLLNTDPPYMVLDNDWDTFSNKAEFLNFTERWLNVIMPKVKPSGRAYISFSAKYQFDLYNILQKNDFYGFNFGCVIIWYYKNNNKPFNRKLYRVCYDPILYLYGNDAPELNFTADTFGEIQQNVWEIATPQSNFNEGKVHVAQKPLELYRRIIKTGSFDNAVILDCFAGSGTTGIVCKELGRKCYLIEKDKDNINIIKGRLNGK